MPTTTYMNLSLPTPGPTGTAGPQWASDLNTAFTSIDAHDHSIGKGTPITPAGLNINADLPFSGFSAASLKSVELQSQGSTLTSTNAVYVVGGNLYYNNGSGTPVQITSGGTINVASLGAITGDYSTTSADLSYSNISKTYVFRQGTPSTTAPANVTVGKVAITEPVTGGLAATIQVPTGFAAAYTLTLPTAVPVAISPLFLDPSGNLTTGQIVTAQITDLNVTTAKLADTSVTRAKMAAVGQQKSSGVFTTVTAGAPVTLVSVSLTTVGRPVMAIFTPDGPLDAYVTVDSATTGVFRIKRGSTVISAISIQNPSASPLNSPLSFNVLDTPSSGTYSYSVELEVGAGSIEIFGYKLTVYEL